MSLVAPHGISGRTVFCGTVLIVLHAQTSICFREAGPHAMNRFYNNPQFSDLTVLTPNGERVHVHQVVLASCSRRFADVLSQGLVLGHCIEHHRLKNRAYVQETSPERSCQ